MQHAASSVSLPLGAIVPPYERIVPLSDPPGPVPLIRPNGWIAILRLLDASAGWTAAAAAVPEIRARHCEAPLILLLDALSPATILPAASLLRLGVRAVLVADLPLRDQLRAALTPPVGHGADVVEWLALRGTPLPPALAVVVRAMFDRAPSASRVSTLLRSLGETEITVRHRFRKRRLPSPLCWLRAARGLNAALRMQAEPDRPLFDLALELGFADHSALSQLLWRAFRVRPREVRGTLGWEWMMHRWCTGAAAGAITGFK